MHEFSFSAVTDLGLETHQMKRLLKFSEESHRGGVNEETFRIFCSPGPYFFRACSRFCSFRFRELQDC